MSTSTDSLFYLLLTLKYYLLLYYCQHLIKEKKSHIYKSLIKIKINIYEEHSSYMQVLILKINNQDKYMQYN
jgi:hypothetical protein